MNKQRDAYLNMMRDKRVVNDDLLNSINRNIVPHFMDAMMQIQKFDVLFFKVRPANYTDIFNIEYRQILEKKGTSKKDIVAPHADIKYNDYVIIDIVPVINPNYIHTDVRVYNLERLRDDINSNMIRTYTDNGYHMVKSTYDKYVTNYEETKADLVTKTINDLTNSGKRPKKGTEVGIKQMYFNLIPSATSFLLPKLDISGNRIMVNQRKYYTLVGLEKSNKITAQNKIEIKHMGSGKYNTSYIYTNTDNVIVMQLFKNIVNILAMLPKTNITEAFSEYITEDFKVKEDTLCEDLSLALIDSKKDLQNKKALYKAMLTTVNHCILEKHIVEKVKAYFLKDVGRVNFTFLNNYKMYIKTKVSSLANIAISHKKKLTTNNRKKNFDMTKLYADALQLQQLSSIGLKTVVQSSTSLKSEVDKSDTKTNITSSFVDDSGIANPFDLMLMFLFDKGDEDNGEGKNKRIEAKMLKINETYFFDPIGGPRSGNIGIRKMVHTHLKKELFNDVYDVIEKPDLEYIDKVLKQVSVIV